MICPNCKTELVEVNGRYICSDCGREIPENEVMSSDWGNGGVVRAGLYGAGTDDVPDEGSAPVADYNTSLSEQENEIVPEATEVTAPAAVDPVPEEQSVEEILQEQATNAEEAAPASSDTTPAVPVVDSGFYTAPEAVPEPNVDAVVVAAVPEVVPLEPVVETPEVPVSSFTEVKEPEILRDTQNDIGAEPVAGPVAVMPEIPVEVPIISDAVIPSVAEESLNNIPETPIPVEETPEIVTPEPEVVKDMFEDSASGMVPPNADPGIYADPLYENTQNVEQPVSQAQNTSAPMPADKKTTLVILIGGSVLVLLLIIGGIWGYLALNPKVEPVAPVIEEVITWQELQVVDGGFKISFPGEPEKQESEQTINGAVVPSTSYNFTSSDVLYSVSFATLDPVAVKAVTDTPAVTLAKFVDEIAAPQSYTVGNIKVGKYYTADAIDFTLSSDTASFKGKLLINNDKYIVIMAGSASGQKAEYDKFVKSFNLVKAESTNP